MPSSIKLRMAALVLVCSTISLPDFFLVNALKFSTQVRKPIFYHNIPYHPPVAQLTDDAFRRRGETVVHHEVTRLRMSIVPPPPDQQEQENLLERDGLVAEPESFDPFQLGVEPHEDMNFSASQIVHAAGEVEDKIEHEQIGIWAARAILLAVAILWGTNFAAVKYLETLCFHPPCNHPPSEAALARFGVAAIASLPFLINQRKDVIFAGMECGFWISMGYFAQAQALQTISAGECAFICSLTVVVVPLISFLLYGKPVKPSNIMAAAVAICGVGILEGVVDFNSLFGGALIPKALADTATLPDIATVVGGGTGSAVDSLTSTVAAGVPATTVATAAAAKTFFGLSKGDLLALGQPLGFGYSFMRIEHYVEKFKDVPNRVLTISATQCVVVGMLALGWVLLDFHGSLPNMSYMIEPHRIGAIAWTGIMTTLVAIYFEGIALQVASATEAALLFASEPVWASLFGAFLLHETLNINSYVGGAFILSACILSAVGDMISNKRGEGDMENA